MEGPAVISPAVLAPADAARKVDGVAGLPEALHRGRPVELSVGEKPTAIVRVDLGLGRSAAEVGGEVQRRVAEYLGRMASATLASVDVVVDGIGTRPAKQ